MDIDPSLEGLLFATAVVLGLNLWRLWRGRGRAG
jgi:hypothetical protein